MPDRASTSSRLTAGGLPAVAPPPPSSPVTFPDGGAWRIEIASVEGPHVLDAVLDTAAETATPVHRVSQGSGVFMLTDAEITRMVDRCADADVELCLFVGPRANWDIGAQRYSPAGAALGSRVRGRAGVLDCVREAQRAADLGVGSMLVADEGVLELLHRLREDGDLPDTLQLKVSVQAAPANPAALSVLERLGADTVNVPSDLSLEQLSELRAASNVPVDFYVEAPDNFGGFVRIYDVPELIRVAAPIYLKFGLRNAPDIYPYGGHLEQVTLASAVERVRRARLALDLLAREAPALLDGASPAGSRLQPLPVRFPRPVPAVAR